MSQLGGGVGYYGDGADPTLPGNGIQLVYPSNLSAEVVASTIGGFTRVGFEYDDGFGWITYDNVTFPWTKGWTSHGFLVDGAATPPAGDFYDAEWVLCGPGDGSSTIDEASNLSLQLEEFNGHNFESVPNAFNFGGDTGESISNVISTLPTALSAGSRASC